MSEKRFEFYSDDYLIGVLDTVTGKTLNHFATIDLLNEQQFIIEELKTHNLQHFLEWLVIKGYVTDEPMKDINNVIGCVSEFKEYLTGLDKFKEWLEVLEDE